MGRFGWLSFAALVALNAVWLCVVARTDRREATEVAAYAACRNAIRRARVDAARIPFPTVDLVRVTKRGAGHASVRGFYEVASAAATWYRCSVTRMADSSWHVDTIAFDQ